MRRMLLTVAILCALTLTGAAQQPLPRFEVASVKPSPVQVVSVRQAGGRLTLALPLRGLIARAYGIPSSRVVGGPPLMSRSFDVSAKAGSPDTTPAEMDQMLKSLLLDRFQLMAHSEMRETDIWVLRLAKNDGTLGPRLKRSSRSCLTVAEFNAQIEEGKAVREADDPCGRPPMVFQRTQTGQPISLLLDLLRFQCCASIEDRTGLTGRFDWDLPDDTPPDVDPNAPRLDGTSWLFTVFERQLGLKVEAAKGKESFLVIDSVEPPTPD